MPDRIIPGTGAAPTRPSDRDRVEEAEPTEIRPIARPTQDADKTAFFTPSHPAPDLFAPPSVPVQPATPVEGHEILGVLGRGGMGIVYKARQTKLDRLVALKMVLTGAHSSEKDRKRFLSEARAVAQLRHQNILQIYEVGELKGLPYFSLEFLEGGTLQEKLEKYAMPPRDAAQLIETLARAVHYAHEKGILHRDIKPGNVLLTSEGTPKISDFGLAKRLDREESLNPGDVIVGTPMYMAPEQALGKADIGPAADIYSLGATLYEMIVGRPPFRGSTVLDTLDQVKNAEPVAPRQLQPSVPGDLQTICLKCLHKDPKQRYTSAEAFANDLRNYLDGKPITARPVPVWEKAWKWSRRNPAAASLIAVSVLSLIGFAIGGVGLAIAATERAAQQTQFAAVEKQRAETEAGLRKQADIQKALAIKNGKEALENFDSALKSIEVLVRATKNRITKEGSLDSVGKELINKALIFYEKLADTRPDDPQMQVQIARAQTMAGELREKLGLYRLADEMYKQAENSFQDLIRNQPDKAAVYRRDLAAAQISHSTVLQVLKKETEAQAAIDEAMKLLKHDVAQQQPEKDTEFKLAAVCNNRGNYLFNRGQMKPAAEAYQQAVELSAQLAHRFPKEAEYQLELARTKNNLAYVWMMSNDPSDKVEPLYQEAIKLLPPLIKSNPDTPGYLKEYGSVHLNRSRLYITHRRFDAAQSDLDIATKTFAELERKFPGVVDYRFLAAQAQLNLGTLKKRQKELTASIAAYRRAEQGFELLTADQPQILTYRYMRAVTRSDLADTRERQLNDMAGKQQIKPGDKAWSSQVEEVERCFDQAIQGWWKLLDEETEVDKLTRLDYAARLAQTYHNVLDFHQAFAAAFRKLHPSEAEHHLQRYAMILCDRVAKHPTERLFEEPAGKALLDLAGMRVQMKNPVAAAQTIDQFSKIVKADSPLYPKAAGVLAQCLAVADKTLQGDERTKAVKTYGDRAMTMLGAAVQAGWKDSKFLESDPLLQPLRTQPAYHAQFDEWQKAFQRP